MMCVDTPSLMRKVFLFGCSEMDCKGFWKRKHNGREPPGKNYKPLIYSHMHRMEKKTLTLFKLYSKLLCQNKISRNVPYPVT